MGGQISVPNKKIPDVVGRPFFLVLSNTLSGFKQYSFWF